MDITARLLVFGVTGVHVFLVAQVQDARMRAVFMAFGAFWLLQSLYFIVNARDLRELK